ILALATLATLRSGVGIALAWAFNLWGSFDLLNAFYQANAAGLSPGQLGAAYFIPTAIVPLLLITHGLMFRVLLQSQGGRAVAASNAYPLPLRAAQLIARLSPRLPAIKTAKSLGLNVPQTLLVAANESELETRWSRGGIASVMTRKGDEVCARCGQS